MGLSLVLTIEKNIKVVKSERGLYVIYSSKILWHWNELVLFRME